MRRGRVAYISFCLTFTLVSPTIAADGRAESLASLSPSAEANPSLTFPVAAASGGADGAQPKEVSSLATSEQLRLYDEPLPVVRVAVPGRRIGLSGARQTRGERARGERRADAYRPLIDAVGQRYAIDPDLIRSIADVESRHNPNAVSPKGAQGLMQVMPALARRFGVAEPGRQLADPAINLDVAAAYLKTLQGLYGNNLPLVLAAYNAGEGAVQRHGRAVPPYGETRAYVRKVLDLYGESLAGR